MRDEIRVMKGEVFFAPAGTPLPGIDPFGYVSRYTDAVRVRVAQFIAEHNGKPYVWRSGPWANRRDTAEPHRQDKPRPNRAERRRRNRR